MRADGLRVLLATVPSDSHTWNLAYLRLLLVELGHEVINLGACTPVELVVRRCRSDRPDLVVVSTVNGHGAVEGLALVRRLAGDSVARSVPVVIGGKLDVGQETRRYRDELLAAGCLAVYEDTVRVSAREFLVRVLEDVRVHSGH
jgi:methylmalonyl-CoA mutase cobalamin-binding subunit